jgi:hypothetical protein
MAWQDDIAEKRKENRALEASQSLHQESITAVTDSGKEVVGATTNLAKSKDIDGLIQEVKELQLASLLGASKPSVILTDQTDLGDKMGELADKVSATIKELDSSETDRQQLAELKSLYIGLTQLRTAFTDGNGNLNKAIKVLITAVQGINVSPVVNVPTPRVTVESAKVDLTPLQDTIKQYFRAPETEKIDLDCYRAQDISESANMQYVGFVNPDGGWYIIENDIQSNSLRYVFGEAGYSEAFSKCSQYSYSLLNEAINALEA